MIPYQAGDRPRQYVKIAPARLDLSATLNPQERKRGLFHATVYDAKVDMSGAFIVPPEGRLRDFVADKDGRFIWNEAAIAFGAQSNLTGLRPTDNITSTAPSSNGCPASRRCARSMPARAPRWCLRPRRSRPRSPVQPRVQFKSGVSLRGTGSFAVQFAGKELAAMFRSSWPSPEFRRQHAAARLQISPEGFEANWQTTEFGSPRITASPGIMDPAMWKGATIGVDLIEATPIYRMINRVAKYGLLFVVLSFATYFFFEVLSRLRIHIVQYGLLGLVALAVLAAACSRSPSRSATPTAIWSAPASCLTQSTLYTAAVARRFMPAFLFALMLSSLFAFLYVLLGLETYSLLIGALALFVVVSALMVLTQMVRGRSGPWRLKSPRERAVVLTIAVPG